MKRKTFKKSVASVAVAAALGTLGTSVQAVNLTDDGLGEVLIFPYYTVLNGYDNYLSVINTSDFTVAFKIRFRESYNSQDVRDFNVILSPHDIWNATVTRNDADTAAILKTGDNSCTSPRLPLLSDGRRGIEFTNIAYIPPPQGLGADGGPTDLERTKVGYFEIIQMGHTINELVPPAVNALHVGQDNDGDGRADPGTQPLGQNQDHPRDCTYFWNWNGAFNTEVREYFYQPVNVLKGSNTLINVNDGRAVGIEPTVLANFFTTDDVTNTWAGTPQGANPDEEFPIDPLNPAAGGNQAGDNLIREPFDIQPNLNDAWPQVSATRILDPIDTQFEAEGEGSLTPPSVPVYGVQTVLGAHDTGIQASAAVLTRQSIVNEFRTRGVAPNLTVATDWIITFPTKHFFVDPDNQVYLIDDPRNPFNEDFVGTSCDDVSWTIYDREEFSYEPPPGEPPFSPQPPDVDPGRTSLCYEVNVITFNNGDVLGDPNSSNIDTTAVGPSGWMDLQIDVGGTPSDDTSFMVDLLQTQYWGLPTIGLAITTRENGVANANLLSYATAHEHGYRRMVVSGSVGGP